MSNRQPAIITHFTPAAWYWRVGDINADPPEAQRLYSSAARRFVAEDDADFATWAANPANHPTNIISAEELSEVLVAHGVPLPL